MLPSCLCSPFWNVYSRYFTFFPKAEVLFKIKLLLWHFWVILFWRTTAMNGFGALLRRNQSILLVLFLLQIQSLGLDMDSRPTTEVCATHTIAPGPKGEKSKAKCSYIISELSSLLPQSYCNSEWLSLLPSVLHLSSYFGKTMAYYLGKNLPGC